MKRWSLFFKVCALIGLTLLMLIPVSMIMDVIDERYSYQREVIAQIAHSSGGAQIVAGPIIVQPYVKKETTLVDGKIIESEVVRQKYFLPENLSVKGDLQIEKRRLAIYEAPVYKGDIVFEGRFAAMSAPELSDETVTLKAPYLIVALADSRGIINVPQLSLTQLQNPTDVQPREAIDLSETPESLERESQRETGRTKTELKTAALDFEAGVADSDFDRGVHAFLPPSFTQTESPIGFQFNLSLRGSQSFSVVPLGRTSKLDLAGNWPHPNFIGTFLPMEKSINEKGFSAQWQSSWFANNINDRFNVYSTKARSPSIGNLPSFDVNLIELVDEYQLTERSVKYSVLFIGLTFIAFFLFEIMKGLRIHPIQYLLVGISLAMFYLILLALSEHIGFNASYVIASLACSGLISFYLSAVLKGMRRGLTFGAGLLVLYAVLFGLLQSENVALLLGTLLLFIILTLIMVLTRHFDWYGFSQNLGGGVADTDEPIHREIAEEIDRKSCRLWK